MAGQPPSLGPLHQIALRSGNDLDAIIAFYRDVLKFRILGRFEPPGIAFVDADGVRLLLSADAPEGRLYFKVGDIAAASQELEANGVVFRGEPVMVHRDDAGQFGERGTEEWMRFFDDPAGNLLAIVERRPSIPASDQRSA